MNLPRQQSRYPSDIRESTNFVRVDPRQLSDAARLGQRPHRVHPPEDQLAAEQVLVHRFARRRRRRDGASPLLRDQVVVRRGEEEREDGVAAHLVDAEPVAGDAGRVADVEQLREPRLLGEHDVPQVEGAVVVFRDEADRGRRPVLLRSPLPSLLPLLNDKQMCSSERDQRGRKC